MSQFPVDPSRFSRDKVVQEGSGRWAFGSASNSERAQMAPPAQFLTGQNLDGTGNAWNQGFLNKFITDYKAAFDRGESTLDWFRDKRDGVALWDDEEAGIRFGDVFQGGQKVENLYDARGKEFADNIMRPMLLSAQEQAKGVSLEDRVRERTAAAAAAREQAGGSDSRLYKQHKDFEAETQREKDSWNEFAADATTVAAGGAGGAVTGAGIGAFAGPVGAAVGGAAGFAAGALGAWLNRDELQDMYARGEVRSRMAGREFNGATALSAKVGSYAQLAGKAMNPLGNVLHGMADTETFGWGKGGDGRSAYYEMDENGELIRSGWWTAADVASGFVSAVGQFGTGVGAGAFQLQMLGQIGGKVGELGTSGGSGFDDRLATYVSVLEDESGDFSLSRSASAFGSVAIDVAQLGFARGTLSAAGQAGRGNQGLVSRLLGTKTSSTKNGLTKETIAGGVYTLRGNQVVGHRLSATAFAPSEFVNYASTRMHAAFARGSSSRGGAITSQEMYDAAQRLATSSRLSSAVMTNATGEGLEEGVQTMLDSWAFGHKVDFDEVGLSVAMGAAMGAGVTVGSRVGAANKEQREMAQYNATAAKLNLPQVNRDAWRRMPEQERKDMLVRGKAAEPATRVIGEQLADRFRKDTLLRDPAKLVRNQALEQLREKELETANPSTDRTFKITQAPLGMASHKMLVSLNTWAEMVNQAVAGVDLQLRDQTFTGEAREDQRLVAAALRRLQVRVNDVVQQFYDATDPAVQDQLVRDLNQSLRNTWEGTPAKVADPRWSAEARAVMQAMLRNPSDNPGSLVGLLPEIGLEHSRPVKPGERRGIGEWMVQLSDKILQSQGGDFDGDTEQALQRLYISPEVFRRIRTGRHLRTPSAKAPVNLKGATEWESSMVELVGDFLLPSNTNTALQSRADRAVSQIIARLEKLLPIVGASAELADLEAGLRRGDVDAVENFLAALANNREAELTELMDQTYTNPWYAVADVVREELSDLQMDTAVEGSAELSQEVLASNYLPAAPETRKGRLLARRATTAAQELWNLVSGSSLFRKHQKLNYSPKRSVSDTMSPDEREVALEMTEWYLRMNSGVEKSPLLQAMGMDVIETNVMERLAAWAAELTEQEGTNFYAMNSLAMMPVADMQWKIGDLDVPAGTEGAEVFFSGKQVSLVQWLLRQETFREAQSLQGVVSETTRARHQKFVNAGPGEALFLVFDGVLLHQGLGVDADVIGAGLTYGQAYAQYVYQDEEHRQLAKRMLQSHSSYTREHRDLPFDLRAEGKDGSVLPFPTAFQAFADALIEAGNSVLTYRGDKAEARDQVAGRIAESAKRTSGQLRTGIESLWSVLEQVNGLDRLNREQVAAFLRQAPQLVTTYLEMLPADLRVAVIDSDGSTDAWLLDALTSRTSAEAEMRLWYGMLLQKYNARGARSGDEDVARSYYDLDDRFEQLMYELAQPTAENRIKLAQFHEQALAATDVFEFMAWVNNPVNGVRGNRPPFVPWNQDVAELDPTYNEFSMSKSLPGSELRESIATFAQRAAQTVTMLQVEAEIDKKDEAVIGQLRSALNNSVVSPQAKSSLAALDERLEWARKRPPIMGASMFEQLIRNGLLLLVDATDKGKPAEHTQSTGAYDMKVNTDMFGTMEENRLASLSTYSLRTVISKPALLLDPMTLQLDDGSIIEWDGLDTKKFVELYANKETRALARAIAFPQVYESYMPGVMVTRFEELSLADLLTKNPSQVLNGRDFQTKSEFARLIDGFAGDHQMAKLVGRLATALTAGRKDVVHTAEQAQLLEQDALEIAVDVLRSAAGYAELDPDSLRKVRDTLVEMMERRYADTSEEMATFALLVEQWKSQRVNDPNLTPGPAELELYEEIDRVEEWVKTAGTTPGFAKATMLYGLEPIRDGEDADVWAQAQGVKLDALKQYVAANGTLLANGREASGIRKLWEHPSTAPNPLPRLTPKEWVDVSVVVVNHYLVANSITTEPGAGMALTAGGYDNLRYADPSYSHFIDDLLNPDGPLLKAAKELHSALGVGPKQIHLDPEMAANVAELLVSKWDPATETRRPVLGPLTQGALAEMLQVNERIDAAAAAEGIAAGGSIPEKSDDLIAASTRTFETPDDTLLSRAAFTVEDLRNGKTFQVIRPNRALAVEEPLLLLDGRFAKSARVLLNGQPVIADALNQTGRDPKIGMPFDNPEALKSGLAVVNRRRILNTLDSYAKRNNLDPNLLTVEIEFFHPDDKPVSQVNNAYFDGVLADGDTWDSPSLLSLWYEGVGGIGQRASAMALEATKKGRQAVQAMFRISDAERKQLLAGWQTDLGSAMRNLALKFVEPKGLTKDFGTDQEYFNAVMKMLKMRYVVREPNGDGTYTVRTVEDAMVLQQGGALHQAAQLVPLSEEALIALVGGNARLGMSSAQLTDVTGRTGAAGPYPAAFTEEHKVRLPGLFRDSNVTLEQALQGQFGVQRKTTGGTFVDEATRQRYNAGFSLRAQQETELKQLRLKEHGASALGASWERLTQMMRASAQDVSANEVVLRNLGFPVLRGDASVRELQVEMGLARGSALAKEMEGKIAHIYRDTWDQSKIPSAQLGEIYGLSGINSSKDVSQHVGSNDPVLVDLDSFDQNNPDQLRAVLTRLADFNANIFLMSRMSRTAFGTLAKQILGELQYRAIDGPDTLYSRIDNERIPLATRSAWDQLAAHEPIQLNNLTAVVQWERSRVEENAVEVYGAGMGRRNIRDRVALGTVSRSHGLLTKAGLVEKIKGQVEDRLDQLLEQQLKYDKEYKKATGAAKDARKRELDSQLTEAVARMVAHLGPDGLYPEGFVLKRGDIIPLHDPNRGTTILLRYGHKQMSRRQMDEVFADGGRIVLFSSETDKARKSPEGEIVRWSRTGGPFGLEAHMRISLQDLGGKLLFGTGFKGMPIFADHELPQLGRGTSVEYGLSRADSLSKGNNDGVVDHMGAAFTYLGIDFRPELAQVLFGDSSQKSQQSVMGVLRVIQQALPRMSLQAVDTALVKGDAAAMIEEALGGAETLIPDVQNALINLLQSKSPSPQEQIASTVLTYLMWEKAKPEDILYAPGAIHGPQPGYLSTWTMPKLFTKTFDAERIGSPLRTYLFEKLNQAFPNQETVTEPDPANPGQMRTRRLGWTIGQDFRVKVSAKDPRHNKDGGWLQFVPVEAAPENPVMSEAAAARDNRQGAGQQQSRVLGGTLGIQTAMDRDVPKLNRLLARDGMADLSLQDEALEMLFTVPVEPAVRLPRRMSTGERAALAFGKLITNQYRAGSKPMLESLNDDQRQSIVSHVERLGAKMGLRDDELEVIYTWIRQHRGRPEWSKDQLKKLSRKELAELEPPKIGFDEMVEILGRIEDNIAHGLLPTVGAAVPQMHMHDLLTLWHGAKREKVPFKLRTVIDDPSTTTLQWTDWVHVALAIGDIENQMFDPMFLPAADAMRQSFLDSGILFSGLPISADEGRALELYTTQELMSFDPRQSAALAVTPMTRAGDSTTELYGGLFDGASFLAAAPDTSTVAKRQRENWAWRKKSGAGVSMGLTTKDLREHGVRVVSRLNTQSTALRVATDLRLIMALANPVLWIWAPFETILQNMTEGATNLITGDAIQLGWLGNKANQGLTAVTGGGLRLTPYTVEQQKEFRRVNDTVGKMDSFMAMMYNELKPDDDRQPRSAIERVTKRGAEFFGRLQDPTYMMSQERMATAYHESVLRNLEALGSATNLTAEYVMQMQLRHGGRWVEMNLPMLHQMALNNLMNRRTVKKTSFSTAWNYFDSVFSHANSAGMSWTWHMFVKWPLFFANYGFNTAVRLSGLQAVDGLVAAMLHGRKVGVLGRNFNRFVHKLAGRDVSTVANESFYNMSEVLEDIDLAHAVAKSGVTITSLFAFGMMAGGLGLGGEDDEDRRRRRIAEITGTPYLHDPRDLVNDFRNADTLYLDNIPILNTVFKVSADDPEAGIRGRSAAEMNFVVKQVMSPLLGVSRFMENGNPQEILWGFEDAVSSLPLISTMGWDGAASAYEELMSNAAASAASGNPDSLPETSRLMVNAVMNLERMLFENSFVNTLYSGLDQYDRDPWKKVRRNNKGEVITDGDGEPLPSLQMERYFNEDTGTWDSGYAGREWIDGTMHDFAEKRLAFALMADLVTLGKKDFNRFSQPVKTRSIDVEEVTFDQAYGVVNSLIGGATLDMIPLEGFYMTPEMREALEAKYYKDVHDQAAADGLNEYQTTRAWNRLWYGPQDNPDVPGLRDVLWSQNDWAETIPFSPTQDYKQLNTTYVIGPDGKPYATGVSRNVLMSLGGISPLQGYLTTTDGALPMDQRLNSVDAETGINLGLRGLQKVQNTSEVNDDGVPLSMLKDDIENPANSDKDDDGGKKSGWVDFGKRSGWRNFGRRRGGGGGGGGGSSTRLNAPQDNQVPYANTAPNLNTNNPIIRRASIRRERSDSQRGRLKPWQ